MKISSNRKLKLNLISIIIIICSTATYFSNPKNSLFKEKAIKIDSQTKYEVLNVVDGDTFDIKIDNKKVRVRMLGIDTPETVDPRKTVQCFGKEASNKTKELLSNHSVYLETDNSQSLEDKYNRILAYITREDGLKINEYLLSNGFAHEYTYKIPYERQKEFKKLEKEARVNKAGLWGDLCN